MLGLQDEIATGRRSDDRTPSNQRSSRNDPVYRKASCACGGACPACESHSGGMRLSKPTDAAEVEADSVADSVMSSSRPGGTKSTRPTRGPRPATPAIQPKKDESAVRTSSVAADLKGRIESRLGHGSNLDAGTRSFMEDRLGADLGGVRVHTGNDASQLNRDLSAKAFTIGQDIFFGEGHYQPDTDSGRRLLAHELVHVAQGGDIVRRCADKKDEAAYDAKIAEIKKLDTYIKLLPGPKSTADTIMKEARDKPDCLYHADKLMILFTTEEKAADTITVENRARTATAATEEAERLKTPEAKQQLNAEEEATADPEPEVAPVPEAAPDKAAPKPKPKKPLRDWVEYPGKFGGGRYKVDARDPTNIFVKVKILLKPIGVGTYEDVDRIKGLEDKIEKHASRKGFTMNIEFVNPDNDPDFKPEAGTFTVDVNPNTWTVASNWAGGDAWTYAHELYHMLNFPIDRYNYIEAHASNKSMAIPRRLYWFLQQMRKPPGYDDPESLMAHGRYPIEEDICTVAQLDMATCLKAREKLFPPSLGVRMPFGAIIPTLGYSHFGGASGGFLGVGYDLAVPLTHEADWKLFIGLNGRLLTQFEEDQRIAFLLGARLGIEKSWANKKSGGPNIAGFVEGGGAMVSDQESPGGGRSFLPGGYGYGGVNLGYQFSSAISIETELGVCVTSKLGIHDPDTFVEDPQMLPFFTAGLRATWMFGGR